MVARDELERPFLQAGQIRWGFLVVSESGSSVKLMVMRVWRE